MDVIQHYIDKMKNAPDQQYPGNEWDIVREVIENSPIGIENFLEWVFLNHVGYDRPRVIAGLKLHELTPERAWQVVEKLIDSNNPDDRDTGLAFIEEIDDKSKFYLLKPLLKDNFAYIQLEACELLLADFPSETQTVLQKLSEHENASIQKYAAHLLELLK